MTCSTTSIRHLALATLLAAAGLAHGADTAQRVALACTQAVCASQAAKAHAVAPAAPRRIEAVTSKKAARAGSPAVDYERDLWRHQSAS